MKLGAPRAGAFIVTFFGDVVAPRGGAVSTSDIVRVCAGAGLNEGLVRTAVSRLMAAGVLVGQREGRRSFYGLSETARAEFALASRRLFAPPVRSGPWVLVAGEARDGFARVAPGLLLGPDPGGTDPVILRGEGGADLRGLVTRLWDLDAYARLWRGFLDEIPAMEPAVQPEAALHARLALVHRWRGLRLAMPDFPLDVLPNEWTGLAARAAFARAYRALSPLADSHVTATMTAADGPLPAETAQTRARQHALALDITESTEDFVDL